MSKPKLPNIEACRGMSEPVFFAFNTLPGRRMVAHGIVFTSFEVGDNCEMPLCRLEEDRDPRAPHFLKYIFTNYNDIKDQAQKTCVKLANEIETLTRQIEELKKELARLEKLK